MKIILNFDEWTMGDVERLEAAAGMSLSAIGAELRTGDLPARLFTSLIYASEIRTNPDFTLEDARTVRWGDFTLEAAPAPLEDPPGAGS